MAIDKELIRPLYSELQGYLKQAPPIEKAHDITYTASLWENYNNTVGIIIKETGDENFNRFKLAGNDVQRRDDDGIQFIKLITYNQKLGGIISYIYGKYFADEINPLSGTPSTIISQNQQQSQSIQIILEVQEKLIEAKHKYPEQSKERKFIDKIKDSLPSIKSAADLLGIIFKVAKDFGVGIDELKAIFS